MLVTTQFPCGNGRVRWYAKDDFEVELIAYSKGARYTCFKIAGLERDQRREVVLRPDACFEGSFAGLCAKIWIKRSQYGEWQPLDDAQVRCEPEAIRFTVDLYKGEECYFSTEPPREYVATTQELFEIAARQPEIASVHCIGHSIEHRPIFLLRVSDRANRCAIGEERVPVVTLEAGEHATEFSGEEMARGMLAHLCGDSPEAETLRREFIFDVVLNINPDGNFHGWHQYNAKDWREHHYGVVVDRSWHHEFEPYLSGETAAVSPETRAFSDWIVRTRASFVIGFHSWLGHDGNPGAFYADPRLLSPESGAMISELNRSAQAAAAEIGVGFEVFPNSNLCGGHLGPYLMKNDLCLAYTLEGHMNLGREKLRELGVRLLHHWLGNERLKVRESRAPRWDAWRREREGATASAMV
ncbi:MAG TPA: M14 family zinc carboxypeptidase [Chthoniobacteraceae bacterium]|nr:M14 family zinc carboxypeptidase [Chthoniobacteraceae bacterium]